MPATTGIKVGNAFIEVDLNLNEEAFLKRMSDIEARINKVYKNAESLAQKHAEKEALIEQWLTKQVEAELKAREVAQQRSIRTQERIALNYRDLQVKYNDDVASAYLTSLKEIEDGGKKLTLTRINEAKQWADLEQREIAKVATAAEQAAMQEVRAAQLVATERKAAALEATNAYKATFMEVRAGLLEQMQVERQEKTAFLAGEIEKQNAIQRTAAEQLASARSTLSQISAQHQKVTSGIVTSWGKAGESIHKAGTNLSELGKTLTVSVVAPLAGAGALLTDWGLKAADTFQNTQTSLENMGMALADANALMQNLTTYGLKTPYAVGDMLTYGTRIARAAGAHNKDFNSSNPALQAKGSQQVSTEAQNIVQMVGDLAARGGITDSAMVQRGYYAIEKLMDADRVSLRDTKQLEYAINMPVQDLAQLLGFSDSKYTASQVSAFSKVNPGFHGKVGDIFPASAQMMQVMADAKNTGGVRGEDLVTSLLNYWQGKTALPGGKPDKTIMGAASRLGEATFSSRISNMKETFQNNLRQMLQTTDPKTGKLEYTGLGQAIMGERVTDPKTGKQSWQGGLLNSVQGIATDLLGSGGKGPIPALMTGFVSGLTTFVGWIKKTSDFLSKHPALVNLITEAGKWAAVIGPIALATGTLFKLIGKITKLMSPMLKLGVGAGKIGIQALGGVGSLLNGNGFANGYRTTRTMLNGGDSRGIFARAKDRVTGNNSRADKLTLDTTEYQKKIADAKAEAEQLKIKLQELNRVNLKNEADQLAGKEGSVQSAARKAADATGAAKLAAEELNRKKLDALHAQLGNAKTAANSLKDSAKNAADKVITLDGKSLEELKLQFSHVKDEADKAAIKTGVGPTSLQGQLKQVNDTSLLSITEHTKSLKTALGEAEIAAGALDLTLKAIANKAPGIGSGPGVSPVKKATGGIIPGYSPGVDNVPAILSPGEAVLRPEVTHALGAERINAWNAMAVRGKLTRKFAGGGIVGKLGLNKLIDLAKSVNFVPDALAGIADMGYHLTGDKLGGPVQQGMKGVGSGAARSIGIDVATKARGIFDFISTDSWKFLKKVPTAVGQAVGIIGGAVAPQAGQYFWNDVWKGNGNVLQRGNQFLGDLLNPDTLIKSVEGLFTGAWDSVKSIFGTAKDLITDPVGTIKSAVGGVWDLVSSEYDAVIDMAGSVGKIWNAPDKYAKQVIGDIYSTAKDALPNTKGLFDFSGKHLTAKQPDLSKKLIDMTSTPGQGDSVTRWTPQVKMAMAQLGIPDTYLNLILHRIGVESGGNPNAVNNWDINAKQGHPSQGLMQTIPSTFDTYAGPYKDRGILNPLASIYAGLNYALHRYGSGWVKALSGTQGYATGTSGAARGWAWVGEAGPELVNFGGGETVLNNQDSMLAVGKVLRGYASGTGSPKNGVAVDAEKGISSLNAAVKKLYEIITKAFSEGRIGSGTERGLNRWLDNENKGLTKLVNARAAIATKLKSANDALAKVEADKASMASGITQTATQERSIADIFNTNGVSVSSLDSGLKQRLAAIKTFQANLATLTKRGFNKDILAEIAQAGPETGGAMAQTLLNSTAAQVKSINSSYTAIGSASTSLGNSFAQSYYSAGEKSAQALVNGLKSQDAKLVKQIESMASQIVNTLRKKLGVRSSSTPLDAALAALFTWLTGDAQAVKGKGKTTVTVKTRKNKDGTTTTYTTNHYAKGTMSASPGMALVGEQGPELVDFGAGGQRVYTARKTAGMLGPRYEIHIHEAKSENTTQAVLRAMQFAEVMYPM